MFPQVMVQLELVALAINTCLQRSTYDVSRLVYLYSLH